MYVALVRKTKRSYSVDFPDFPGCVSGGDTVDEALRCAAEALSLHVRGMVEDGERLPQPTPVDVVITRKEAKGAIPALLPRPSVPSASVRINISVDASLLTKIDEAASAEGMTRSGWIAAKAREALHRREAA
ncbi:MAG TPA: type II toxin-antitoxin system HicB family antitoxin [Polyangiaceae bacterium]|jgi:predicted RNase H-like HicB family nuclease|nr:type II toxin-antitoxin system HicB family antitoxin [Polyangiaceae bacterium]